MSNRTASWAAAGDVNAFFGLMLDNIAGLLLAVGLLHAKFGFPTDFALHYMVPGTAIGVFVGDLLFFFMALRLQRLNPHNHVTAMPLGLDTPSTFGMVFFVIGPAFLVAGEEMPANEAARYAWHIGICAIFISGLFKIACAGFSAWVRSVVPRAGLLGSLAAIALVLISFLPLVEVLHAPVVGFVAFAIILMTLVARLSLGRVPGALLALLVGAAVHYAMGALGWSPAAGAVELSRTSGMFPSGWMESFRLQWLAAMGDTLPYLPVVLPFALATVVGGIDCTESAAAAGDEYPTNRVILVEGFATLAASLCGGVIQTTPYIGHPAYKAMGGRAAYVLATALFVGSAGVVGYFGYIYAVVPKAAVYPILIFIGLEITAQSFHATPKRHYSAVALACVPALASLVVVYVDKIFGEFVGRRLTDGATGESLVVSVAALSPTLQTELNIVRMLASGFVVTSLLWASSLAAMVDRRIVRAAVFSAAAGCFCLFGLIHSPLAGGAAYVPWQLDWEVAEMPLRFAGGYFLVSLLLLGWNYLAPPEPSSIDS